MAGAAGKATAAAVGSSSSSEQQQQLGPGDDASLIDKVFKSKQQAGEEAEEQLRRLELEEFDRKLQERLKE